MRLLSHLCKAVASLSWIEKTRTRIYMTGFSGYMSLMGALQQPTSETETSAC